MKRGLVVLVILLLLVMPLASADFFDWFDNVFQGPQQNYPLEYDGSFYDSTTDYACSKSISKADSPPINTAGDYPYKFTITTPGNYQLNIAHSIWAKSSSHPNRLSIKLDGTLIFSANATIGNNYCGYPDVIDLGDLTAKTYTLEINQTYNLYSLMDYWKVERKVIIDCSETDDGLDYDKKGSIEGNIGSGYPDDSERYEDYCLNSSELVERYCSDDYEKFTEYYTCPDRCEDGACVTEEPEPGKVTFLEFKISLIEGIKDIYSPDEELQLTIQGLEDDDTPTSVEEGFNVQVYVSTGVPGEPVKFGENARYFDGYWYIDSAGPFEVGTYELSIALYCANDEAVCADRYENAAQVENLFSFEVKEDQIQEICTDTDGGNDRYVKGTTCLGDKCETDNCWTDNYGGIRLEEHYCSEDNDYIIYDSVHCSNGCQDGACVKTDPVSNHVCQDLIDKVANPYDFSIYGLDYRASSWNNVYEGDWWINGESKKYTEYSSSWNNHDFSDYNDDYYEHTHINVNMIVFEDKNVDLREWIADQTSYKICKADNYWIGNEEQIVYVCSWDILRNQQDLDNYEDNSREILWINDNVVLRIYLHHGRSLTDEEVSRIAANRLQEFMNDLRDNEMNYVGWENLDISYPAREFIYDALQDCGSDVQQPVIKGTNFTCWPRWNCKIEPVICPPHGFQKRICVDYGCDSEKREEQIHCSPGICAGCYVPRWMGDNYGNNRCIPYGFRFEQQTEDFEEKLIELEDPERLDETLVEDDLTLDVISDTEAILVLYDRDGGNKTYRLIEGETIEIEVPEYGDDVDTFTLIVDYVHYSDQGSYVDLTIKWTYMGREYIKENMYCDIDGRVKRQMTVDYQGNWAKCQNNYECLSNICSSGECIEVQKVLDDAKGIKRLAVRILCRLAHLFSEDNYNNCIFNFLGEDTSSGGSSSSSSGGGGNY